MQDALGLSRGLHVISMMYEHNYEIALHAQNRLPDRVRSVIVPWPGITDGELDILTKSAWWVTASPGGSPRRSTSGWSPAPPSAAGRCTTCTAPTRRRWTAGSRISSRRRGSSCWSTWAASIVEGHRRRRLQVRAACLDTGRCWVKLSPRISKQDNFPFSDTDPLVKKLVQHAPTRILWGSDWPHPQYFKPMPNDVALLDMMLDWCRTRRRAS